jgi:DNA-binding transcriptional LysR family regulator
MTRTDGLQLDWLHALLAVADGRTGAEGPECSEGITRPPAARTAVQTADLERALGVRLIDRSHRPPRLTPAGEVFARRAREILSAVGAARSELDALAARPTCLRLLTTSGIGSAFLPGPLTRLAARYPGLRLDVVEADPSDLVRTFAADGVVIAVLPALAPPLPPGLRHQVLWREPLTAVVPGDHELARSGGPVSVLRLGREPLVVTGTAVDGAPEVLQMLALRGVSAWAAAVVPAPQTAVAMARHGLGVAVVSAVALGSCRSDGTVPVVIDDAELHRDVALYWYDTTIRSDTARALHREVTTADLPAGALPPRAPLASTAQDAGPAAGGR